MEDLLICRGQLLLAGIGECPLWKLPVELLFSVVAFLDGKALSSLVEALYSAKEKRHLIGPLTAYIMKRMNENAVTLLSQRNQPALANFVQTTLVPKSLEIVSYPSHVTKGGSFYIHQFSEWCLLMDYVLRGTRSNSLLWPVGSGVFATSPLSGGNMPLKTRVVLSVPQWHPAIVSLCHEVWLPNVTPKVVGAPTNFSWLPSEGDIDGFVPDQNIGLLSCFDETNNRTFQATKALARDDDFLQAMGRPDCCLSILPSLDCPIFGPLLQSMIQSSKRNAWVLAEEYRNNNMLCFFDTASGFLVEGQHEPSNALLVDRIIHLMKTCR